MDVKYAYSRSGKKVHYYNDNGDDFDDGDYYSHKDECRLFCGDFVGEVLPANSVIKLSTLCERCRRLRIIKREKGK